MESVNGNISLGSSVNQSSNFNNISNIICLNSNFCEEEENGVVPLWIVVLYIVFISVGSCINFVFVLVLFWSRRNGK